MPNYNQAHAFYADVDLHASRSYWPATVFGLKGRALSGQGAALATGSVFLAKRDAAKRTIPALQEAVADSKRA